jgi:hypothetical protein
MSLKNPNERWGAVSQSFHWLIVLLLLAQGTVGLLMGDMARGPDKIAVYAFHKSVGITILALAVARLLPGGHERIPVAALVVVDEVHRPALGVLEREDGGQHAVAVAADHQPVADGVDADDEVLDVVAQDDPAVAVLVLLAGDRGAGLLAGALEQLLHLGDDRLEVGGRERLEDDRGGSLRLDPVARRERDVRRRHREELVGRRALELLLAAEDRVQEAH